MRCMFDDEKVYILTARSIIDINFPHQSEEDEEDSFLVSDDHEDSGDSADEDPDFQVNNISFARKISKFYLKIQIRDQSGCYDI